MRPTEVGAKEEADVLLQPLKLEAETLQHPVVREEALYQTTEVEVRLQSLKAGPEALLQLMDAENIQTTEVRSLQASEAEFFQTTPAEVVQIMQSGSSSNHGSGSYPVHNSGNSSEAKD